MTDSDVQDIRDMVLAEKSEENKQQMLLNTMAKLTQTGKISSEDRELQEIMKNLADKDQEGARNKLFNPTGGERSLPGFRPRSDSTIKRSIFPIGTAQIPISCTCTLVGHYSKPKRFLPRNSPGRISRSISPTEFSNWRDLLRLRVTSIGD